MSLPKRKDLRKAAVCVVGLGYVGLPLAVEFARSGLKVVGYDVDAEKVGQLRRGVDPNGEIEGGLLRSARGRIAFTSDPRQIRKADFVLIAVPTPIHRSKVPDLSIVEEVGKTVGKNLKRGAVVVLESTVYPGVTEETLLPILEKESKMKCGRDFRIGYSPERINPGDGAHGLRKVVKVVSGCDDETRDVLAGLYSLVADAGVFKAKDIRTAEAAKVIENIQRDVNIALMNELAMMFKRMGIDISEVLKASYTKWNFGRYYPGLVGGHCIPVDPYYLLYKARDVGYHPQVVLVGRAVNDSMPKYVAELVVQALNRAGKVIQHSKVLVLGLTFKENVRDTRTSQAHSVIAGLKEYGAEVLGCDPMLGKRRLQEEFGIRAVDWREAGGLDGALLLVPHREFERISLPELKRRMNPDPVLVDVRGLFDPATAKKLGFHYERL